MQNIELSTEELQHFGAELQRRKTRIHDYIADPRWQQHIQPAHIYGGAHLYLGRTGKALRPVYLMWCAGALGGAEREDYAIIPAAAVEIYHTWGLVHDDIIDMDDVRRGGPSVHRWAEGIAKDEMGYSPEDAERYGLSIGILAGDILLAWIVAAICELYDMPQVNPDIPKNLIRALSTTYIPAIVEGETLDIQFEKTDPNQLSVDDLLDMSFKKTGTIFTLAGLAGACIGLNAWEPEHPQVQALVNFAHKTGLAFQIIDDVINITGEAAEIGKSVGSDIVLGKRTIPIIDALQRTSGEDNRHLNTIFGSMHASVADTQRAIDIIKQCGAIDAARDMAFGMVGSAFQDLDVIPESPYKTLITLLGRRLVDRKI